MIAVNRVWVVHLFILLAMQLLLLSLQTTQHNNSGIVDAQPPLFYEKDLRN